MSGKHDEAIKTYRRAFDLYEKQAQQAPLTAEQLRGIAWESGQLVQLLVEDKRFSEADANCHTALAAGNDLVARYHRPEDHCLLARTQLLFADVLARRGKDVESVAQTDDALREFTKAIELKPDLADALNGRAFIRYQRQQFDGAIRDFSKAIEIAPEIHTNWLHRGHCYLWLEQWDKAASDFGKVIERWPNDPEGWYLRAVAYAQMGKPNQALADLREAVARGFKNVERIKGDPRIQPLSGIDEFNALLTELGQKRE
jgi:tetratricopeptide (TPR) repeat protein